MQPMLYPYYTIAICRCTYDKTLSHD